VNEREWLLESIIYPQEVVVASCALIHNDTTRGWWLPTN